MILLNLCQTLGVDLQAAETNLFKPNESNRKKVPLSGKATLGFVH